MKVLLTGGTGFVGGYVLSALLREGHNVRCVVRSRRRDPAFEGERVEQFEGDVIDPASLNGAAAGCDAVIHLVGIVEEKRSKGLTFDAVHFNGTKNIVDEAVRATVPRFIHMSANGARKDGVSRYQTSKWKAEEYVRQAGFDHYTIFRPSTIFGDPGEDNPEFAVRLARSLIKPFPVLPIFGDGSFPMQPVSVEEVASAFVQALTLETARRRSYCVAGEEQLTYKEMIDRITWAMGYHTRPKISQPIWLVRPIVHSVGRIGLLPISPDQFEMLIEGNTCDSSDFYRDFDVTYRPFVPGNLDYVRRRL